MPTPLYIILPPKEIHWVAEVQSVLPAQEWVDWELVPVPMDRPTDFQVDRVLPIILRHPGPAVVSDCAAKASQRLKAKLITRLVVCVCGTPTSTDLWTYAEEARRQHVNGDPPLPCKYVAAVCIVRKLNRRGFWGGTNEKNHQAVDDLCKGGIPTSVQFVARDVVEDLRNKNILIAKYGGARKDQKYALNGKRRDEIARIVSRGEFPDEVMKILMRDKSTVPRTTLEWGEYEEQDESVSV